MQDFSSQLFRDHGITFTVYNDNKGRANFSFWCPSRIIKQSEWNVIEAGIKQRIRALNLFLRDAYHEQFIFKDGIIPRELLVNNGCFIREMKHLSVPNNIYTHISEDLIRSNDGEFYVLEDNLRTPRKLYARKQQISRSFILI